MKFRKKPVVIDAMQFNGDNHKDLMKWAEDLKGPSGWGVSAENVAITTLEGTMLASKGDWIICGVKGEFYPCKPDIFEATYEPA